jgi:flagellar basal body-associated protein FliL
MRLDYEDQNKKLNNELHDKELQLRNKELSMESQQNNLKII